MDASCYWPCESGCLLQGVLGPFEPSVSTGVSQRSLVPLGPGVSSGISSGVSRGVWGSPLEAQQRYFSYRAMLVAIVSRNAFVLVFMGYRTIIERYVAKWGIAQIRLCETKYQGGVLTSLKKVSCDTRYRSDSIAISRDMGPLRGLLEGLFEVFFWHPQDLKETPEQIPDETPGPRGPRV